MKINELIQDFEIHTSNEESAMLTKMNELRLLHTYTEREQVIIENLIRKALVSKIVKGDKVYVLANDQY